MLFLTELYKAKTWSYTFADGPVSCTACNEIRE
jgi:hypothetical protein